jgi:MPBQ/MSBQ methyltransferase
MRIRGHKLRKRHLNPAELYRLVTGRPNPKRIKVNTQLRFLHEVLGLERFHYGLWSGEEVDIDGLRRAQARYAEMLASWIPAGVETVLDVGCGIGTDTLELARRGYTIEGLSPDPHQRDAFVALTGLPFHLARFQDFQPPRRYDLVLMSESAQYIWLHSLFPAVARAAPGGHLLVADYFTVEAGDGPEHKSGHPLAEFDAAAAGAGFELLRDEDITDRVLPTLELATLWLDRYAEPSLAILGDSLRGRYPRLGRTVLGRVEKSFAGQRRVLDPEVFARAKRYLARLYRVPRG